MNTYDKEHVAQDKVVAAINVKMAQYDKKNVDQDKTTSSILGKSTNNSGKIDEINEHLLKFGIGIKNEEAELTELKLDLKKDN